MPLPSIGYPEGVLQHGTNKYCMLRGWWCTAASRHKKLVPLALSAYLEHG